MKTTCHQARRRDRSALPARVARASRSITRRRPRATSRGTTECAATPGGLRPPRCRWAQTVADGRGRRRTRRSRPPAIVWQSRVSATCIMAMSSGVAQYVVARFDDDRQGTADCHAIVSGSSGSATPALYEVCPRSLPRPGRFSQAGDRPGSRRGGVGTGGRGRPVAGFPVCGGSRSRSAGQGWRVVTAWRPASGRVTSWRRPGAWSVCTGPIPRRSTSPPGRAWTA